MKISGICVLLSPAIMLNCCKVEVQTEDRMHSVELYMHDKMVSCLQVLITSCITGMVRTQPAVLECWEVRQQ